MTELKLNPPPATACPYCVGTKPAESEWRPCERHKGFAPKPGRGEIREAVELLREAADHLRAIADAPPSPNLARLAASKRRHADRLSRVATWMEGVDA